MEFPDIGPAMPELWLAVAAMALLLIGVFRGDGGTRGVLWLSVAALAVTGWLIWQRADLSVVTFSGLFITDRFAAFAKILILVGSALTLILSLAYLARERLER